MGKPLAVDWHEVQTLAKALGVREAARRMNISEAAVMQRSKRYKWFAEANSAKAALAVSTQTKQQLIATACGVPVSDVSKQLSAAEHLSALGPDTKLKLAVSANKAVTHLAEQSGEYLAGESFALLQHAKVATIAHSWQEKAQSGPLVSLAFYGSAQAHEQVRPIIDIDPAPDTGG